MACITHPVPQTQPGGQHSPTQFGGFERILFSNSVEQHGHKAGFLPREAQGKAAGLSGKQGGKVGKSEASLETEILKF